MPENRQLNQFIIEFAFFFLQPLNMLLKIVIVPLIKQVPPDFMYSFPLLLLSFGWYIHGSFWIGLKMYLIIYCVFSFLLMKSLFCGHRIQDTWT